VLAWIDEYGDRDDDGFQEYQTLSTAGYENMAWKDSGDAVMYPDGTLGSRTRRCAIAGYVYDACCAWQRFTTNSPTTARQRPTQKAAVLFRISTRHLDEKSGFLPCIGWREEKVLSCRIQISGQCLWSGIHLAGACRKSGERLMREDSERVGHPHPLGGSSLVQNPYNYQTGAVWPHDNSLIALGMRRYGFAAEAAAVARDITARRAPPAEPITRTLWRAAARCHPISRPVSRANVAAGLAAGTPIHAAAGDVGLQQDAAPASCMSTPRCGWLPDVALTIFGGQAALRYPLLAGRPRTRLQGVEGKPDAVERMSMTLSGTIADR